MVLLPEPSAKNARPGTKATFSVLIARASNYIGYANANRDATALVDPAISSDPAIYPDLATLQRLQPSVVLPPKLERRRSRTWTKVKTGL